MSPTIDSRDMCDTQLALPGHLGLRHSLSIPMAPTHKVKPPNFDGTGDVMQFLSTFEEVKQVI